jgi:16S rRNA (uracil1498-N3)-methyltransferase
VATAGGARGPGPERAFAARLPESGTVRLDAEEGRHLVRVRRTRVGDAVVLFDGRGGTRLGRLVDADPSGPAVEVVGPYPDREPTRRVAVASAFPGAGRADDLVVALAECGVDRLVPLRCERQAVDPDDLLRRRADRFERLAREAAKVNGRSRCLRVEAPRAPADVAAAPGEGGRALLLDPDPSLPRVVSLLPSIQAPVLLVGPEGGFTDGEIHAILALGVPAACLWECALRTETAAVAAAALALAR